MSKSQMNSIVEVPRKGNGITSHTRLKAVKHLRFIHTTDHALLAVEFEAPPSCSILGAIHRSLAASGVSVPASATRLTQHALYQWFQVCENDGSALTGVRRDEIVKLFIQVLATANASEDDE